jgi:high-affinity iron transporter
MLGSALIVFREIFEAALVIGIVLAATQGVPKRTFWVTCGVLGGVIGAGLVAFFAEGIASAAQGFGQELFNASVLFIAVIMLTWHQVWMSKHGREISKQMKDLGLSIKAGAQPLYVLAVVVGAAMLREGSEAVLFLYGIAASNTDTGTQLLIGGLIGLAAGAVSGIALYLGLLKIPTKLLFTVTGWMIMLLAAGMASQGAASLVQANLIPALGEQIWNTSSLLNQSSLLGRVMHTLIGYDERPAGIQVVFYIATLTGIILLTKFTAKHDSSLRKLSQTMKAS